MNRRLANLVLWLAAVAFALGLLRLFTLRFEAGDVYPPYSSLRADPLGTMVLFESLARVPKMEVARDFSSDNRLPSGRGSTYLHLAATRQEWLWLPEEVVQQIQGYVLGGGRLVIAFLPETSRPLARSTGPAGTGAGPGKPPGPGVNTGSASPLFKDRWGVEFGYQPLNPDGNDSYRPIRVANRTELALPQTITWHSGMVFTNVNAAWATIYSRGTNPVVIERKFGSGSVVLSSDSFFLSNEAMLSDRHPDLLAWLVGSARRVEFDEAHLGLVETPGVASLIRKYRLGWLVAGFLVLTGLFIWKHSMSFCPPSAGSGPQAETEGKDAAAGFVNLLRRNIPPQEVLKVCFEQWAKSFGRRAVHSIARVDQAQAIFAAEAARPRPERDSLRAYHEIRNALKTAPSRAASSHAK